MNNLFYIDSIINAANYEQFCDFAFIPPEGKNITQSLLENNGTIFCKTDFIVQLFDSIKNSRYSYNVITHHSDYPIDEQLFNKRPSCIKKWYAINPTYNHTDLIAIPLGLKTHKGCYFEPHYMTEWFAYNIERLRSNKKEKNIYCNWNPTNDSRNSIKDILISKNISITYENNIPFNDYIEEMSRHRFVISPPGNGIDCHRTWEALYIGCIPIVVKHPIYDSWNLPIIQVEDYSEITQDLLDNYVIKQADNSMLYIDYWQKLICF
jgi:hypothetical protein